MAQESRLSVSFRSSGNYDATIITARGDTPEELEESIEAVMERAELIAATQGVVFAAFGFTPVAGIDTQPAEAPKPKGSWGNRGGGGQQRSGGNGGRPASPKQVDLMKKLAKERDTSGINLPDDPAALTGKQASELIDELFAAPEKSKGAWG